MSTSVFCPTCANLLLVEECEGGSGLRFCCATCPYVYNIDKTARASALRHAANTLQRAYGGWKAPMRAKRRCPRLP